MTVIETLDFYKVDYNLKGTRAWLRCPSGKHTDNNPSFNIDIDSGLGHCFSCSFSTNMTSFLKAIGKDSNVHIITTGKKEKKLASNTNILLVRGKILDVYEDMEVYNYLKKIGCSDKFIDNYEVSYSKYAEFIDEETQKRLIERSLDSKPTKFIKKVLVPVYRENRLINIIGRDYTEQQELKEIYPKGGISDHLFNIENVDYNLPLVVNEGFKDLVKIWRNYSNVVSTFGTSISTNNGLMWKAKELCKFNQIILFLDNDLAGNMFAEQFHRIYSEYGKGTLRIIQDNRTFIDKKGKEKGYDANNCSDEEIQNHLKLKNGVPDMNSLMKFNEWFNSDIIKEIYRKKDYNYNLI